MDLPCIWCAKPKEPGTYLKLRTSEADKVRCGEKHFDAIGVPFDVVVSADDV